MDFLGILSETFARSGFANLSWQQGVMLLISFVLLYCAIVKGFEPLLLLPIAFGMMLANLPDTGIMTDATEAATLAVKNASAALAADPTNPTLVSELAAAQSQLANVHWYDSGVLRIIHRGVKSSIFPCLIFMGVGAMTDFGPLLANPISLLLGAAAQLGIYIAFIFASCLLLHGSDPAHPAPHHEGSYHQERARHQDGPAAQGFQGGEGHLPHCCFLRCYHAHPRYRFSDRLPDAG